MRFTGERKYHPLQSLLSSKHPTQITSSRLIHLSMRLKHHFDTVSNLFGRAFSAYLGNQQTRAKLETSK